MSTNAQAVTEKAVYDESFEASADLTDAQYRIVKLHTVVGQIALAGAGEGIGVLQNKPNIGEAAQVRIFGLSRVKTKGSNGEPGQRLASDATGFGVVAAGAGQLTLGQTRTTWTIEEEVSAVLLTGLLRLHA